MCVYVCIHIFRSITVVLYLLYSYYVRLYVYIYYIMLHVVLNKLHCVILYSIVLYLILLLHAKF